VVFRMVPPLPTTKPVLASVKKTEVPPIDCEKDHETPPSTDEVAHVFPPSMVCIISPPTA